MPRSRPRSPFRLLPALALILALGAWAPPRVPAQERTISLNQKSVQIKNLIKQVGEATGRTILFDEQVRGTISIVAKRPVTLSEAWTMLETSLSLLGYSLLPSTVGNWRIAKIPEAIGEAPFVTALDTESDSFVTTLITLDVADLEEVMDVLRPLAGAQVTLVPFEPSHSLIASGPERAIARLTTIVNELDQQDEASLRLRVLRYRDVDDVEPMVEALIDSDPVVDRELEVWSDKRTNSIVYRGSTRAVARLVVFLDRVDRPIEGEGELRVLRVLNRDPEQVAEMLRSMSQSPARGDGSAAEGASALANAIFDVAVDGPSRSLVVRADGDTQDLVRKTVEMIDEPPQLVAIDITISELQTPNSYSLGFAFSAPVSNGLGDFSGALISSPRPGALVAVPGPETTVYGRLSRDTGVPFTIDGGNGIQIPILQSAVIDGGEFEARNEVLLQPSLIAIAGERQEIFVGENVPIPVSDQATNDAQQSGNVQALLQRTVKFDRKDLGIRLTVVPKAGREGPIQLELEIEVSRPAVSAAGDPLLVGPTYANRTLNVTAKLEDGENAIIAIDNEPRQAKARLGTPWLSDIPFLGWFFTYNAAIEQDSRLIVSARARRVSSPSELVADTIRRRLAFQRSNARGATLEATEGSPYGVLVTTRRREDDADAIAQGLSREGHQTKVHRWTLSNVDYYDVYIVSLKSMADAAEVAGQLSNEGWDADLVVLPTRS